jgi:hypothetical protein
LSRPSVELVGDGDELDLGAVTEPGVAGDQICSETTP